MSTEADFRRAIEAEPRLCGCGIASVFYCQRLSNHLKGNGFAESRAELFDRYAEFCRAVDFLSRCQLRDSPNPNHGNSYRLKHTAERWAGEYVSNGALIAAAIHLDIPFTKSDDSLNVYLAVSSKCPMVRERCKLTA